MMLDVEELESLAECASLAARAAGQLIQNSRPTKVGRKEGGHSEASTIVTEVDLKSQEIILEALQQGVERFSLGVLSEELDDDGGRFESDYFWCIDPLDGTLPYVESRPGFAVSIALVSRSGIPEIGVVYDPTSDTLYSALRGGGIRRNGQPWSPPLGATQVGLSVFADRSFTQIPEYASLATALDSLAVELGGKKANLLLGSGAVMNACHALAASPACYFKFPKAEGGGGALWDFAATACLFAEAGAVATDIEGEPLDLNRAGSTWMNQRGVLFATDTRLAERITAIYRDWCKSTEA
jgi:myo-inositol-1(or 4)-monophosphatase